MHAAVRTYSGPGGQRAVRSDRKEQKGGQETYPWCTGFHILLVDKHRRRRYHGDGLQKQERDGSEYPGLKRLGTKKCLRPEY